MRPGVLATGILLAVVGFILFVVGYTIVQEYQTSIGQIGRILSPQLREQYQQAVGAEIIGGIFLIVGIITSIAGAVSSSEEKHRGDEEIILNKVSNTRPVTTSTIDLDTDSEVVYCPYCGTENAKNSKFCTHCGRNISEIHSIRECPKCGSTELNVEELSMAGKYGTGRTYRFITVICQRCGYTELYFKEKSLM